MATNVRIQIRGDTADKWEQNNPKLLSREIGYDSTARRLKVGDGKSQWKDLPFLPPDVIDDLTTGGRGNALSAEQGKELKQLVDGKADKSDLTKLEQNVQNIVSAGGVSVIDNLTSTSKIAALSANQGKVLKGLIDTKANTSALTTLENTLKTYITTQINNNKVAVVDNLTTSSATSALSAKQGVVLKGLVDAKASKTDVTNLQTTLTNLINKKADTTTVTNLQTTLTNLINQKANKTELTTLQTTLTTQINNSKVSVVNSLTSTSTVAALSANQGKVLNDKILERPDKNTVYKLINDQMEVSPVSTSGGGNGYFKIKLEGRPYGFSMVWGQISLKNQKVTFNKFSTNSANAGYIGELKGSSTTPSSFASGTYATPIASIRTFSWSDDTHGKIANVVPLIEYVSPSNTTTMVYKLDFFPRYRDGAYVNGASITVNMVIDYVVFGR